jgi:hypothetical protein
MNDGGGARCGASGGTEMRSRMWDKVRRGAAVLGLPFIGREAVEGGRGGRRGGFFIPVGFDIESGRGVDVEPS